MSESDREKRESDREKRESDRGKSASGRENAPPEQAGSAAKAEDPREFQRAVDRLEGAVDELVTMAKDQFSDRATSFVQDTADRLQREIENRRRRQRKGGHSFGSGRATPSHSPGPRPEVRRSREARDNPYRTRELYRDTRNQKIAGVCAGIARYFGMEVWVVRCIAVTGLIFMGQIVAPAYVIASWVMPKEPKDEAAGASANGRSSPWACSGHRKQKGDKAKGEAPAMDHSSPAPELGVRLSPRRSLRDVQWNLDQMELKLRRMETHVTSGQYELQRELKKIDT